MTDKVRQEVKSFERTDTLQASHTKSNSDKIDPPASKMKSNETVTQNRLGLLDVFSPPVEILSITRWLFLICNLVLAFLLVPIIVSEGNSSESLRAASGISLVVLCSLWGLGYVRGRFSFLGSVLEGLALIIVGLSAGEPRNMLGLLFACVSFRALYGSLGSVTIRVLVNGFAYISINLLSPLDISDPFSPRVLVQTASFLLAAGVWYGLGGTLAKHQNKQALDSILNRAGGALMVAVNRESIYSAALDAIGGLVRDSSRMYIAITMGNAETMTVATSAGGLEVSNKGEQIVLGSSPDTLRERFLQKLPMEVAGVDAKKLGQAIIGKECNVNQVLIFPLPVQDEIRGAIIIASEIPIPAETRAVLGSLWAQIALALESISLIENLHMRQSEERFFSLVQNSSDVITIIDVDTTIHYLTPSVDRVFGYSPSELIGTRLADLLHSDDMPRVLTFVAETASQSGVTAPMEWRLKRRDGSWLIVENIGNNLLDDPNVRGVVLNTRDITERKQLEQQLTHQAFHDPLTNLANRALFRDRVEHAIARSDRSSKPIAVLFLDMDDFKTINDSLGHAAGDHLLVLVADRLRACLRPADTAARLGGDEFAILLEDVTHLDDVTTVAERIIETLKVPFNLHGKEVYIGASLGIAFGTSGHDAADEILRNADVAMYIAKNKHKGRYEVFEASMHTAVLERLELEADLQRAILKKEFSVHYQPIVELDTGSLLGFEALARWIHPEKGLIPAIEFIALAEETGLVAHIDHLVLEQACRQAMIWQTQHNYDPPLSLSVNLSGKHLQQPELVTEIEQVLLRSGLAAKNLILEITESVMMQDMEAAIVRLQELKDIGIRLAIDDFGTGYSSLSSLRRFPIDILKIDKSFVDGIGNKSQETALMRAIITLAYTLHLQTVAEGIERPEQLDQLRQLGCDLGQGYFFARPLDKDGMEEILRKAHLDESWLAGRPIGGRANISSA